MLAGRRGVAVLAVAAAALVAAGRALDGGDGGDRRPPETVVRAEPLPTPHLDRRVTVGRDAPFLADFDPSAMYYSAAPDQIRAVDDPFFDEPGQADLLEEEDLVVGIELGGEARAYPVALLSLHEVVNDVVGGVPVAITWCPLCRTATAFERRVGGRVHAFGVSGLLYSGNLILFDRTTGSLWSQLLGGAVTGQMRGRELRSVPVVQETWSRWRRRHPEASVLSIRRDALAHRFTQPGELDHGELTDQPYATYWTKVSAYFHRRVRGLQDGSLVLGVVRGGSARAYLLSLVRSRRAINDRLGGEPILVAQSDQDAVWGTVFARRLDGKALEFSVRGGALVDSQTRSRWELDTGRAVAGPLAGRRLRRLPATSSYWFAWRGLYPRTTVRSSGPDPSGR
jgi:Protein of unknown function (DUF3179)